MKIHVEMGILENIGSEFKTRNFSIYGQWTGILSILICLAVGISNFFHADIILIWAIICVITGFLIIFLEVPLLLRICPTSKTFDDFMRKFHSLWGRAGFYIVASVVQWTSLIRFATSLIAAAVLLLLAGLFYVLAAVKGQEFTGSKTLGGQGIAQMMV